MQKLIWMDADRVFYRGLLGQPNERVLGALTVYASTSGNLRLSAGERDTLEVEFAVIAPYTPHRVASADGWVHCLLIEPDYLDWAQLPAALNPATPAATHAPDHADLARRIREAGAWLQAHPTRTLIDPADFDLRFFGLTLPHREPDPRIAAVMQRMRSTPADAFSAQDGAQACGLSASRFLHLFKDETGASFRNVRTWKRARALLERAHDVSNLTDLALDLGYPDATHFSHAIRRFYGLKPSDIVAGSRRLARVGKS